MLAASSRGLKKQNVPLPGFERLAPAQPPRRYRGRVHQARTSTTEDHVLNGFRRRLVKHGSAPGTVGTYVSAVQSVLRAARSMVGKYMDIVDLFRMESILGRALAECSSAESGQPLSRWRHATLRSSMRRLARLMHPELHEALREDATAILERALRGAAVRVGGGYRLPGGQPRGRGGAVPSGNAITRVLEASELEPGLDGLRNRAFFRILASSGARVNALRSLDARDCVVLPSGRMRLTLHEKGKRDPREIELSREDAAAVNRYINEVNRSAERSRLHVPIVLGRPSPIWRSQAGRMWGYKAVRSSLSSACERAGVPPFTPHAFRRAYATDAASSLPRHTVALAGNWSGVERLDDHYVHPRAETIWMKLDGVRSLPVNISDSKEERAIATPVS